MDSTEFRFESNANAEVKKIATFMLYIMGLLVALDIGFLITDMKAGASLALIVCLPLYFAAYTFRRNIVISKDAIRFENTIFGKTFIKEQSLKSQRFIHLNMPSNHDDDQRSYRSLDIHFVSHDVKDFVGVSLWGDISYTHQDDPHEVADLLYKIHTITGRKMRFDKHAMKLFYTAYVDKYGTDGVINPTLIA